MSTLLRSKDWSQTPLGPLDTWPHSLKVVIRILLTSRYAMWLGWGPELIFFYNDAYQPTLGVKHPGALGRPAREVWPEIWSAIGPRIESVRAGVATWDEGLMLLLERSGYPEETYHTFSYSPVPDDAGGVGGMLCVVTEDTERLIGERRLALLRELATDLAATNTESEVFTAIERRLAAYPHDLPFTLTYLFDADGSRARLACTTGIPIRSALAPPTLDAGTDLPWPAASVLRAAAPLTIEDLPARFPIVPTGAWDRPARQAVVAPIAQQGQERPAGFLVAGINPYRPLDTAYRGFLELLVGQIASSLANARSYEQERRRAEALAELDRAKTAFFSNVSHEFRTPLTLMLGPVEDLLAGPEGSILPQTRTMLTLVHRNGQRLLKLVNTLLDFSRIEAGRVQAIYEPTDLAAFTAELASVFRSAIERAGLGLVLDCPPLSEPAYVDRDMWEKIVLNLVSNAFKYTLDGEIRVALSLREKNVELAVRDTGIGIPAEELPKLFNRFHRVEGARGRTHEGTGIGLALVQELARLHGGSVHVESVFGQGSTFFVTIPTGKDHLPNDRISGQRTLASTALGAHPFVEEALRWLPAQDRGSTAEAPLSGILERFVPATSGERPRVLLADDNADMREYVRRLLGERYEVLAVADGQQALEAARSQRPDLVLTDVMMPRLDGFELLRALRADPRTQTIPLIMLSARAGEEARVEGLGAGADDYLIKPFSARELIARVGGTLAVAQARREALRREEELRAETTNVLESITDGFLALDPDFRFTYLNAEAERINGCSRAEVIGKDHFDVYPQTRGTIIEAEFRRVMRERVPAQIENYFEPWDRWFELDVYPSKSGGLAVYFRDITERKKQTEQLHELARAAVAINASLSTAEVLQVVSERARQVIGAHQAVAGLVGDSRRQQAPHAIALSDKYASWRTHADQLDARPLLALLGPPEQTLRLTDAELRERFGREPGALATYPPLRGLLAVPLVARDERGIGYLLLSDRLADDFTARDEALLSQLAQMASVAIENAQLHRQAQEAKTDAEAANRMKDEFLATLSHELRTPLNAILGWARILQTGRVEAAGLREGLATIERSSKLQAQLIEDLLDVSRIISGKLRLDVQRVNLAEVIEAALATVRPALEAKEIRLHCLLDSLAGPVNGDPARLQQVVWNLLSNAVKFTPRGGRVQVLLERVNSHVEVSVIDSGQGIKPEFLPHVFDRFRQADASTTRRHGGLGLGLSIVKHLVEMHGGTVWAKSPGEGQGSTFTVTLPVAVVRETAPEPRGARPAATDEPHPPAPLEGVRVLVVDDEPDARELVKRILSEYQAEVRTAGSATEALATLEGFAANLLLSDIGMPERDGYDLIRQVRAGGRSARDLPAVALTAFARPEDRRRALLSGFQMHVTKPVDPEELVAVVASLVGRTGPGEEEKTS